MALNIRSVMHLMTLGFKGLKLFYLILSYLILWMLSFILSILFFWECHRLYMLRCICCSYCCSGSPLDQSVYNGSD